MVHMLLCLHLWSGEGSDHLLLCFLHALPTSTGASNQHKLTSDESVESKGWWGGVAALQADRAA
jgi:hypothetical protein